jgi:hypothetical protein
MDFTVACTGTTHPEILIRCRINSLLFLVDLNYSDFAIISVILMNFSTVILHLKFTRKLYFKSCQSVSFANR